MPLKKITNGDRFGKLVVIGNTTPYVSPIGKLQQRKICRCDCGKLTVATDGALRHQNTRSCGCLLKERKDHGQAVTGKRTRTYTIWLGIKQRCTNPNYHSWPDYGGRGITIYEPWKNFLNFFNDMGTCPDGLSIERIDNNGSYVPGNVKWATTKEQCRNKRTNRIFTVNGNTACLADLCETFNQPYMLVLDRLRSGWPIAKALMEPKRHTKSTSKVHVDESLT